MALNDKMEPFYTFGGDKPTNGILIVIDEQKKTYIILHILHL